MDAERSLIREGEAGEARRERRRRATRHPPRDGSSSPNDFSLHEFANWPIGIKILELINDKRERKALLNPCTIMAAAATTTALHGCILHSSW